MGRVTRLQTVARVNNASTVSRYLEHLHETTAILMCALSGCSHGLLHSVLYRVFSCSLNFAVLKITSSSCSLFAYNNLCLIVQV